MKNAIVLAFALLLSGGCAPAQNAEEPEQPRTDEEKTEEKQPEQPQPEEEKLIWARVSDGDQLCNPRDYSKILATSALGTTEESRSWSGGAWKNDHVSSRWDFLTYEKGFPQVGIETSDLVSDSGAILSRNNITVGYLAAVETKSEAYPDIDYQVYDIITRNRTLDLEAAHLYSAWIDIYVPENTPKGVYRGKFSLSSAGTVLADFDYELEVFDLTLTRPEEWEPFLDLWETPFASNRYYSGKTNVEYFQFTTPERQDTNPFSLYYVRLDPQYQAGLESELELYHQAGGNTISVQVVEGPDNSRFPCPTPSMIKWNRKADGSFTWDYTDMDYWIELNLKHGINRQIDLFHHTGVGWGFVYYDEETGEVSNQYSSQPGQQRWREISHAFLTDLVAHLEEKGWFEMAVLYMDERLYDVTKELVEAAEGVTNSQGVRLKVGGAVNGKEVEPLYDRMYDVSIWENARPTNFRELCQSRREKGLQTTLYSCGSGKMSSTNQPAEAAFAVYEARKFGADGVMRWALNKFDEDPIHGTLHTTCYPGDCYLIYPDEKNSAEMRAQSTPRFEKLCEGMRISEKLHLIGKGHPEYADAANAIIASPVGSPVKEAAAMRVKVRELSRAIQNGEPAPGL